MIPANIRLDEDVLNMYWRLLSCSFSEEVFKASSSRFGQDEYISLSTMSSEDVFKASSSRLDQDHIYSSWPYTFKTFCQYVFKNVFKTSLNHLEVVLKAFSKHLAKRRKNVFKTSSRRLANMSSRNVFKTYHQVKLFLITRPPEIFEAYSTRFWDVLPKRLYTEGFDYNNSQDIWD